MTLPSSHTLRVGQGVLLKNDAQASANRAQFRALRLLAINLLSSPGAGKTALLERTLRELGPRHPMAVIVGDLATDNDARRLCLPGAEVVQINTGNVCHLDASMIAKVLPTMALETRRILFLENVGNLVCPASFDLGENYRVVLFSVTEGEDKALKYPRIFKTADLILVSKADLAGPCAFARDTALTNLGAIAPQAQILEVSSRTGEGMDTWYAWLEERVVYASR
ncbi:MAG: hydrogenase nickel incorporation protein HypB [Gemmataceae bacterium]